MISGVTIDKLGKVRKFSSVQEAQCFAEPLLAGEEEGWDFRPAISDGEIVLQVIDENGEFCGYWMD